MAFLYSLPIATLLTMLLLEKPKSNRKKTERKVILEERLKKSQITKVKAITENIVCVCIASLGNCM